MKLKVVKVFRDKDTKEMYSVGDVIECDEETAENRLKLGLVERIETDNHPPKDNSKQTTEPENKENKEDLSNTDDKTEKDKKFSLFGKKKNK